MKVECTKIINELEPDRPPPAVQMERLTIGKRYDVLEVSFSYTDCMCWYRIECDDGKPWLMLSTQFKIVCSRIPKNWIVSQNRGGVSFSPESWLPDEFWERFFSGDETARQIFEQERQNMAVQ